MRRMLLIVLGVAVLGRAVATQDLISANRIRSTTDANAHGIDVKVKRVRTGLTSVRITFLPDFDCPRRESVVFSVPRTSGESLISMTVEVKAGKALLLGEPDFLSSARITI